MKILNFIIIIALIALIPGHLTSQTATNQIDATLVNNGSEVTVIFTPNSSFQNTGEASALKVWLKMPAASSSSVSISIVDNPFSLALIGPVTGSVSGADRIFQYQVVFGAPLQYSSWSIGTPVSIGTFSISGYTSPTLNVGLATFNFSGTSWNGTSINRLVSGNYTNLVVWPITSTVTLPIKLSSFSAVKDGDRSARLDWTSASEVNSAYFGIERSTDGINWQAIDRVAAAGNSSSKLDYQYYDRNLPISRSNDHIFYYRLQLVDLDGQYKYSDVRGVNFEGIASTDVISLYPNPTTSLVNIDLRDMDIEQGSIHLIVVDMAGRLILNKTINGNGIEPIDVSRYDAGSYQVLVTQGSQQHQKRFIKAN